MTQKKVSELDAITSPADDDLLMVVDTSEIQSKKITWLNAKNNFAGGFVEFSGTPGDDDFAKFTNSNTVEGRSYSEVKSDLNLEIGIDVLAQQTIGIADNNLVEIDQADAASGEYARLTANGIESRSKSETQADLDLEAGTDFYSKTAEDAWRNGVTQTEMGYVGGVTSDIQTQIGAKAPVADPTFTGEIGIGAVNVSEAELGILEGATLTTTELNYVDGVASAIQTQLDGKAATSQKIDDFGTADDNTDLNTSVTEHGLAPKLDNNSEHFLNGQGGWTTPAGTGSGTVNTSGTPVANDFARFTAAETIEGRSYAEARADFGIYGGSGTFNGTTGDTITIGVTLPGTSYRVSVTPIGANSEDVGAIWVDGKTTTQFTVKNTGSSVIDFDWMLLDFS